MRWRMVRFQKRRPPPQPLVLVDDLDHHVPDHAPTKEAEGKEMEQEEEKVEDDHVVIQEDHLVGMAAVAVAVAVVAAACSTRDRVTQDHGRRGEVEIEIEIEIEVVVPTQDQDQDHHHVNVIRILLEDHLRDDHLREDLLRFLLWDLRLNSKALSVVPTMTIDLNTHPRTTTALRRTHHNHHCHHHSHRTMVTKLYITATKPHRTPLLLTEVDPDQSFVRSSLTEWLPLDHHHIFLIGMRWDHHHHLPCRRHNRSMMLVTGDHHLVAMRKRVRLRLTTREGEIRVQKLRNAQ